MAHLSGFPKAPPTDVKWVGASSTESCKNTQQDTKGVKKDDSYVGYETALHLIDVRIKDESLPNVKKALDTKKGRELRALVYFLEEAHLSDDGFLSFRSTGRYESPYVPDESDGTVSVLIEKWYESETIAEWLKLHSEKGGRLIQHSMDADGAEWGWEFDGRGRLRELTLRPVRNWK